MTYLTLSMNLNMITDFGNNLDISQEHRNSSFRSLSGAVARHIVESGDGGGTWSALVVVAESVAPRHCSKINLQK